ncbi:hypothetical protein Q3O97_05930 [Ralstonia pseudosolanacearum]|uniref:hypothetical protein n=1 Tax=Ralstonia pseudosolanacearum TaxID=1310165 RepID=UPI0026F8CF59|nr:hypothetical protein [Ralstonia pseudosolanacearum]MDO3615378.1 hypothetical protein [Ralstonia pseudosolanacearum]
MSLTAVLKAVVTLGIAIVGILSVAERLCLVNSEHYPRFLAKDVGTIGIEGLDRLRVSACAEDPVEVYAKADYWVLRCGVAYIQGRTFISHTDPFENLRR